MPSERPDKLQQRCESILQKDEPILLDTECSVYRRRWPFPVLGAGRAFLTRSRLIWIRRSTPMPLHGLLRWMSIPDAIDTSLNDIEEVRRERWGPNSFLIRVKSNGTEYSYRLGHGPYPLLRRNPETSDEWFRAIRAVINMRHEPETGH